ncbi:TIGR02680 family protein [Streptoalloteichus tenebrarius]|uniref:TIGR02680 family protein n=2 Tax=Streptoalloteichus tenebrarius (strain ATCC 17920 / DSM 40477 / JCM 4838 / CBS 697.72 / NBRC 16177 / NCIMB 11028 / NRRL B-12390 / A12253. 1 / ISP 5477) TaxID=1933 RepID=A0ABT1HNM7_STRSD|nr:TIGR02680 family protein [Streptoalloteichus tenebrarius]
MKGGLPEPSLHRWQPLRVGILNLWEYDQAEFWFADGRLVLRGGNGAGKTKVLELTTLMLLRGEIGPSVLDPFGSQHRTMRFNLLPTGEDDDPRPPSDAGLGYAWAEFGRLDDDGTARYFVCGLGVSARRGSGTSAVTPWHLITHLRPGRDLQLSRAGRPLDQKELKKVPGVTVPDSAARYRERLASELFGLGSDAYDNLTELLKQLRKPKLGERLNPASLAETLRAALPPLASTEITQLADGWDNLEKLRTAVEQIRGAAVSLAAFVRYGWTPWARTVVRHRADALTAATTELDRTTKDRRAAENALATARGEADELKERISQVRAQRDDLGTELRELLDSQAFQDAMSAANRVEGLREQLGSLTGQLRGVEERHTEAAEDVAKAAETEKSATRAAEQAESEVVRAAERVRAAGRLAGLDQSVTRHLAARDVPALRADLSVRRERFARLQELRAVFERAESAVARSADLLADRESDLNEAVERRELAHEGVEAAVDTLCRQIREWNASVVLAKADEHVVEQWCDLVAELTAVDPSRTPAEQRGSSPVAAITRHVNEVRDTLSARRTALVHERAELVAEHDQITAELAAVLDRAERPPAPPDTWRRRDRPEPDSGLGAPFWRCVQPVGELSPDEVDLLEATLAAAGVLDAWLSPDGGLTTAAGVEQADTVVVRAGETRADANLTAVLEPTSAGGVPESVIRAVLTAIGWHDSRPDNDATGTWLAADGTWRCAALSGRAEVARPASHLGATARESARQREIHRLRTRLAELEETANAIAARVQELEDDLRHLGEEIARLPGERVVTDAVTTLRERERQAADSERKAAAAMDTHRVNETARDTAWAAFSTYASEHAFPLDDLPVHDAALQDYRHAVDELARRKELLDLRAATLAQARSGFATAQRRLAGVDGELNALRGHKRQVEVRLRTAQEALTSDVRAQLDRRAELDRLVERVGRELDELGERLTSARITVTRAEETLGRHEERRQTAERRRDAVLEAWWEVYDAGLAQPLGLAEPERRSVESARESTRAARRELPEPGDVDRAWRHCYSRLEALRQELLPDRDARVLEPEHDGALQRVAVLADSKTGWQAPPAAADLLANQVREQENAFDSEQQRVLTTLLGSTFIEHLKDRLDYTARTFTDINKQLISHPTRHGNAVQLKWEPDPTDPDAGTVVDALTQGYHQLSPARQETVRSFLARKIDAARADAAAGGSADWREQLSTALDYRGWLKISLQYRPGPASRWVAFDAAKHGAKSGGEKVVLLSQPLFAAAFVAYNAAGGHAPRCVWLDEAMTGVDEEIKASFMGLTVSFDLDVMLTAHDEWCKYPTVPAVAVYDLARHKGLPGVDAVPYLWCGGEWTSVPLPASDPRADEALLATDGLFAEADAE